MACRVLWCEPITSVLRSFDDPWRNFANASFCDPLSSVQHSPKTTTSLQSLGLYSTMQQTKHGDPEVVRHVNIPEAVEDGRGIVHRDNVLNEAKEYNGDADARTSTEMESAEPEEESGTQNYSEHSNRRCCGFHCSRRLKWGLIILLIILVLAAVVGGGVTASLQKQY